jgi:cardiolipin synthase C
MAFAVAALKIALGAITLVLALLVALRVGYRLPPRKAAADPPLARPRAEGVLAEAAARLAVNRPGQTGFAMLADGPAAFAARVALIDSAQSSIDAQYYIWHGDLTGALLLDALRRAADRGVRVRLLVDDNGIDGLDAQLAELDAHPNAAVRIFNPFVLRRPKWLNYAFDFLRLNHRMHNKSLTVDGAATIVGGRNVGDKYFGAGDAAIFIDLDVLAVGAVVKEIEADFELYWQADAVYDAGAILARHDGGDPIARRAAAVASDPAAKSFREALANSDDVARLREGHLEVEWAEASLVSDDPRKALDDIPDDELLFSRLTEIVGRPTRRLDLVSPYFVPGRGGTAALATLARRGVEVRILTNALEATDVVPVHAGYAKRRRALLKAGVRLFELKRGNSAAAGRRDARALGPFGSSGGSLHAKTFAVDGRLIYVGSLNFDQRSLRLNTEMGVVIRSERLARHLHDSFSERMPDLAYRPALQGLRLVWRDGDRMIRPEPGASLMRRAQLALVNRLPVEWLL